MSEASASESQKLPRAGFRQNAAQSSSILNRVKLITTFPPRQYQRKGSPYLEKFHSAIVKQIFMRLEVGLSSVFVLYPQVSSPRPGLANLRAFALFEFLT